MPPEIGAVVRKALDAAVEVLRESSEPGNSQGYVSAETDTHESPAIGMRRADALRHLAETLLARQGEITGAGASADRYQVVVHVDQAVLAEAAARDNEPHCCEFDDGPALRRALRARDGGCRFPGCDRTRFTEGHHVKHWADGGETKLGNLVTLCSFHHRLVHGGSHAVAATDDGVFVFMRPDGRRVPENDAECLRGNNSRVEREEYPGFEETLRLHVLNREAGIAITPETSRCRWLGERMDYSWAIEGMQFLEQRAHILHAIYVDTYQGSDPRYKHQSHDGVIVAGARCNPGATAHLTLEVTDFEKEKEMMRRARSNAR